MSSDTMTQYSIEELKCPKCGHRPSSEKVFGDQCHRKTGYEGGYLKEPDF